MLKKIIYTIMVALFLLSAPNAYAHILKTDGTIGAVMHINPDDDPIAAKPSDFFFEIKDTENKFSLSKCHCEGLVIKNDQIVYSTSLSSHNGEEDITSAGFTYTFPDKGIYTIMVNGMPLESISFKTFSLKYTVRVDREEVNNVQTTDNDSSNSWLPIALVPITVVSLLLIIKLFTKLPNKGKNHLSIILIPLIVSLNFVTISHYKVVYSEYSHSSNHHMQSNSTDHLCCLPLTALGSIQINLTISIARTSLNSQVMYATSPQKLPSLFRNKSPPHTTYS